MEFYEAIEKRRTVREWKEEEVDQDVIKRIVDAGIKAPSNNHLREWEFIVLFSKEDKENALCFIKQYADRQKEKVKDMPKGTSAQKMYAYAIPRQYSMLHDAPYVIIPLFKGNALGASAINSLNGFASVWCVIENILLAAAAEGLGTAIRIPIGEEGKQVLNSLGVPEGYTMPAYIGIGYPKDSFMPEQLRCTVDDKMHYGKW